MFAFAIWDEREQKLFVARDRFGEKPFYYAFGKNNEFIFASEIKTFSYGYQNLWNELPFADTAAIPTYLLSKDAAKHVKVVLGGDGADELLGGYGSYEIMDYYFRNKNSQI